MQADMAPPLSNGFHSETGPARSLCGQAGQWEQTEAGRLTSTVDWAVNAAMADADSPLSLGKNVGLAVVSEKDLANYTLHSDEDRILSPQSSPIKFMAIALASTAANFALKQ